MKIVLTGHTKGIGSSLKSVFEQHNHEVLGFSKSTGHDISNTDERAIIIDALKSADVFINNAYHPIGQIEILKNALDVWEGQNKFIINISSKIVYIESDYFPDDVKEYRESKVNAKKLIDNYTGTVRIYNIFPDLLKTDFALSKSYFDPHRDGMDTETLASLIYDLFKYRDKIHIPEIEALIPGKRRGSI